MNTRRGLTPSSGQVIADDLVDGNNLPGRLAYQPPEFQKTHKLTNQLTN
jgi:hypothetical protein